MADPFDPFADFAVNPAGSDPIVDWVAGPEGALVGQRVASLGQAVRESVIGGEPIDVSGSIQANAGALVDALARHPLMTGGVHEPTYFDLFFESSDPRVDGIRAGALGIFTLGAVGLAFGGTDDERLVDALLATAFGADAASRALGDVILGRKPRPRTDDPHFGLPKLLDQNRINQAIVWGTINDLIRGIMRAGAAWQAASAWASRATANATGITGLTPDRGCGGTVVTIAGSGFGANQPANTSVRFPTTDGGCADAPVLPALRGTTNWSDTSIRVVAPQNVGIGCVGFLVTDGPPPVSNMDAGPTDLQNAAGMLQSVLGDFFGPQGVMFGQTVVDAAAHAPGGPHLPCPPCLPAVRRRIPNRFIGGPPVLHTFTVQAADRVAIHPGDQIVVAWNVEGADTIAFTTRTVRPGYDAELPPLPVPSPVPGEGSTQPFPVPYDGADDWSGEYLLTATNPCGTVTASVRVEMKEQPPLFGLADLHVHFFSHLAFAGYGIWGKPSPAAPTIVGAAGLADALAWCDGVDVHGPGGVLPSLEGRPDGHLVGGYPEFDGWPRSTTMAHQQAYVDWIKRAVDGGLRLVVCLAVNSELLANRMADIHPTGPTLSMDDMSAVDRQLKAMQDFVTFVAAREPAGQNWVEIAYTPADARRIVSAGRLALVMGIEVDNLGGWHTEAELTADAQAQGKTANALIATMVGDLYNKGIRHVFPIHGSNNAFGGAGLFVRNYDAANYFATGESFVVEEAPKQLNISYRIDEDVFEGGKIAEILGYHGAAAALEVAGGSLAGLAIGGLVGGVTVGAPLGAAAGAGIAAAAKYTTPPKSTNWSTISQGGHINAQGMTNYGILLIDELMRRGMLIDIDHMGHKTTETALARVETYGYPVVCGHTGFRAVKYGFEKTNRYVREDHDGLKSNAGDFGTANAKRLTTEVDKSHEQLQRVRTLGGMVSVFTHQRDVNQHGVVANDGSGSSKSLAQSLQYAAEQMHGRRVAIGTDVNGAGQLPGPRFGPGAMVGIREEADRVVHQGQDRAQQTFAQRDGVRYSTPISDYRHHRFMDYAGHPDGSPFDDEQRDFWEAIAIWRSGTPPVDADQPPVLQRTIATQNFVINLATGLRANIRSEIPISIPFPLWKRAFYGENADEQLAAFLASHPTEQLKSTDPARTQTLVAKLTKVWQHWQHMENEAPTQGTEGWIQLRFGPGGTGLYDTQGNLVRSNAGRRDFDINIDGMAHYGLLPDLMQDLRNAGVVQSTMDTLYRSAEDYIRVWERCEARKLT
jgi:microsomal dipeptidase-like Zn-dependent dipeptidase